MIYYVAQQNVWSFYAFTLNESPIIPEKKKNVLSCDAVHLKMINVKEIH